MEALYVIFFTMSPEIRYRIDRLVEVGLYPSLNDFVKSSCRTILYSMSRASVEGPKSLADWTVAAVALSLTSPCSKDDPRVSTRLPLGLSNVLSHTAESIGMSVTALKRAGVMAELMNAEQFLKEYEIVGSKGADSMKVMRMRYKESHRAGERVPGGCGRLNMKKIDREFHSMMVQKRL